MGILAAARGYYSALAHYKRGEEWQARGRLEEAIAEFQEAVRLSPDYAEAHQKLGMALYEEGRIEEACVQWKKVLTLTFRSNRPLADEAEQMLRKLGWKPVPYWKIGW